MTASYATLKAFPAPQVMCNEEDRKWALRNAKHMFNNLKSRFLRQASNGPGSKTSDKQTIMIGHDTTDGPALWVRNFTGDGKVLDWPIQEEVGIDFCNQQLEGTGWRVVEILPTLVNDTTRDKWMCTPPSWDKEWCKKAAPVWQPREKANSELREHQREHGWWDGSLEDAEVIAARAVLKQKVSDARRSWAAWTEQNPFPKMPALKVVMEYTCQSAAKYPGQ